MLRPRDSELAASLCGEDVRTSAPRTGLFASLDRLLEPEGNRGTLGRAARVLEPCVGTWIWASVMAIWNALCAELFADQLPGRVRADLEEPWLEVIGTRPTFIR